MINIKKLQENIGYEFKDESFLKNALIHTSFANENKKKKIKHNERLEFLGDSVLGLTITTYLYSNLQKISEGEMSRIRSTIVCENSLRLAADKLELSQYIYMGKGEEQTGGRQRSSIIADAMEALFAAIYLDAGFERASEFVLFSMKEIIDSAVSGKLFKDYKTQLQESMQKKSQVKIEYIVIAEEGPDHQKQFTINLMVDGNKISQGEGKSKKEAEQSAAKVALEKIND